MLNVYTRHADDCETRRHGLETVPLSQVDSRCACKRPQPTHLRQDAQLGAGRKLARKLEGEDDPIRQEGAKVIPATVRETVELFLADQVARGLELSSQKKYRTVLKSQFLTWTEEHKILALNQVLPADLTRFRSTWGNGESTTHRKHEMLMCFFSFCVRNEYLRKNPMEALSKPKTPELVPTDYFRPEEFDKIIDATYVYDYGGGNDCQSRAPRLRALTLLMRWSGLFILDAVSLERDRLSENEDGDDQIFLYRAKTNVPVYVVIPPDVAELLRSLPNLNPRYFFWSGNGDPRSAAKAFQRSYWKLFKLANILLRDGKRKRCHPHMFRDTFAVELLLAGNPIDQVSLLLGHSSVKITERHYAPFCKARQQQLTTAVKRSWNKPNRSAKNGSAKRTKPIPRAPRHPTHLASNVGPIPS